MPAPIYLDLLDDGIPRPEFHPLKDPPGDFERRLMDTLRFQLLLACLFQRRIIVPEAWAVSSPVFLHVAAEYFEGQARANTRSAGLPADAERLRGPFVFAFGSEAGGGSAAQRFASSLLWRLRTGRRLAFSPTLSGQLAKADEENHRKALSARLSTLDLSRSADRDEVPAIIADGISREGESGLSAALEGDLRLVLRHLGMRGMVGAQPFDRSRYETSLDAEVERVRQTVAGLRGGGAEEALDIRVEGLWQFFERIRREGLSGSQIMVLWSRLGSMDIAKEDKLTLEAFGRFVLNRAYASALGAQHASAISFDAYARENRQRTAGAMLDRLLLQTVDQSPFVHDFVAMASRQAYDLVDTLDWHAVWEQVASFASSTPWKDERDKIVERIRRLSPLDRIRDDAWYDVFDRVNAALHGHMKMQPDGGVVLLLRDIRSLADRSAGPLKALKIEPGDTPPVQAITRFSIRMLARFVDVAPSNVPAYLALKAERAIRHSLVNPVSAAMLASLG